MPNLKFVSLIILELNFWALYANKGLRDPGHAPFSKQFFRGHVSTFPGSVCAKFEIRIFNLFEAISI